MHKWDAVNFRKSYLLCVIFPWCCMVHVQSWLTFTTYCLFSSLFIPLAMKNPFESVTKGCNTASQCVNIWNHFNIVPQNSLVYDFLTMTMTRFFRLEICCSHNSIVCLFVCEFFNVQLLRISRKTHLASYVSSWTP